VIDMMTKQVRPASGKPITTLAIKAVEQRLASARAAFIMARSHTRSTKEAEDTFAVRPERHHERSHLETRTEMPRRCGRVKAKPPFGRCAPRSLDRPTRRGALPLCDEGQAFVAGYGHPRKGTNPVL